MASQDLGMAHMYIRPVDAGLPTLLLLHGTGGDENDLIPLGRTLLPGAGLLSPRGSVSEHGMNRFFLRLAEGVFDIEDLHRRTAELVAFIAASAERYEFDPARVIAIGFSNGANIAASVLLSNPTALAGAVLVRPMVPFVPETPSSLANLAVLIEAGDYDNIASRSQTQQLTALLKASQANVDLHSVAAGHSLTEEDVVYARQWLRSRFLS